MPAKSLAQALFYQHKGTSLCIGGFLLSGFLMLVAVFSFAWIIAFRVLLARLRPVAA